MELEFIYSVMEQGLNLCEDLQSTPAPPQKKIQLFYFCFQNKTLAQLKQIGKYETSIGGQMDLILFFQKISN